ncbi:MAG: type II toxin-antitoxin system Phd/YefM family antitoxin [Bacilli bacterium]|nr:type II toxin-antitoxin system Phd/YefM family antitoxin [Bacilli bacterium]
MEIIASTLLRNKYNEISKKCKKTNEPIYLTKNGEGDLVLMSIEAYEKRERFLKLKEELLDIEFKRLNGAKDYSLNEAEEDIKKILGL